MRKFLLLTLLCSLLAACGGGGGSSGGTPPPPAVDPLDPTALTLDNPPTNGMLPADLLPPT